MKNNRDLNPSEVELFNTLLDDVYRWRKRDNIVINEVRDLHLMLVPRRSITWSNMWRLPNHSFRTVNSDPRRMAWVPLLVSTATSHSLPRKKSKLSLEIVSRLPCLLIWIENSLYPQCEPLNMDAFRHTLIKDMQQYENDVCAPDSNPSVDISLWVFLLYKFEHLYMSDLLTTIQAVLPGLCLHLLLVCPQSPSRV